MKRTITVEPEGNKIYTLLRINFSELPNIKLLKNDKERLEYPKKEGQREYRKRNKNKG